MSDITFGAVGGNWNTDVLWGGAAKPTAADNAILGASSAACTLDADGAARSVDFSGYTVTFTHAAGATLSIGDATPGNSNIALRLASGMTYTLGNNNTSIISFVSTSATVQDIDLAGKTIGAVVFNASSNGSWRFTSTFAQVFVASVASVLTLTKGTLNTNGQTVNINGVSSSNSNVRSLILGSSQVNLASNGTVWNLATSTNMTLSALSSTINMQNGNAVTFAGGGLTYGKVYRDTTGGTGTSMTITGSNTFNELRCTSSNAARTLLFTASTTTTIATLGGLNQTRGSAGKLITLDSVTAAAWTISSPYQQALDYVVIKNSQAVGGPFYAGSHSQDGGGNTGWIFTDPPPAKGGTLPLMGV